MRTKLLFGLLLALSLPPAIVSTPVGSAKAENLLQFASGGHALGFSADGVYAAAGDHALHVAFAGANAVQPQADSPGSQEESLGRVVYANLWDGITLAYASDGGSIYTSTFRLAPGADPSAIRLSYNVTPVVNSDGSLGIVFATGALTETAPIAWQVIGGERQPVDAHFRVNGREVAFTLGAYDPRYALTIDPALVWHTFLGGSADDRGESIAVDKNGNLYVTGHSSATWGSPIRAFAGGFDAFVAKLNPSGGLVWNTFLGQGTFTFGYGIDVDGAMNVYVAGYSDSTWGSPVRAHSGGNDAFAAKLNSSGVLIWNAFLGSSTEDRGMDIDVDGSGNTYVVGFSSATWGTPAKEFSGGWSDAFVAKLYSSGALAWHAFLGGGDQDTASGVVVDSSGNVYVAGDGYSTWGTPVRAFSGYEDAFAAKLNSSGTLLWNTFLGGSNHTTGGRIALRGNYVYETGWTDTTWGSPVRPFAGVEDVFAAKLDISSGALAWNTFLGGSSSDRGGGIYTDRGGNVYVTGDSESSWGSPLDAFAGTGGNAFAAKLSWAGALINNTFLGIGDDAGNDIAFDQTGTYVTGLSGGTWGSPVRAYGGGDSDAFVARIVLPHTCALEDAELYDLTGDCRTDVAVYRPSTGAWYLRNQYSLYYGSSGDIPVPGDYDGDGITDIAVYRPSSGAWYVRNQYSAYYGQSGDIPVPGDYDGDGDTDVAVFRPATGAWYIRNQYSVSFGQSGDIPVPADYDGDSFTDVAVYRPSTGAWYIRYKSKISYGVSTDIPVPGDYDGDGDADIAVYRPSTGAWYVRGMSTTFYGGSADIPVPGDYDGDGTTELAVYRPATGAWYVRGQTTVCYGSSGDIPLPEMGTGKAGSAP
jgi:hypothetical protein